MAPLGSLGQIYLVSTAVGSLFMCFSLFMGRVGPQHGHGGGHGGGHAGGGHGGGHAGGHGGAHAGGHGGAHAGGHGAAHAGGHGGGQAGGNGGARIGNGHGGARLGNGRGATPNAVAPGHGSGAGHGGGHAGGSHSGGGLPSEISIAANQQFNTGQATALSRFHMPAQGDHSLAVRLVELLNPMMIATFLTYFGLTGLIAHFGLPMLSYYSLVPALIVGYISTQLLLYVMNWMSARMGISSAALAENFVGLQAQVILPIADGRLGEISYETGSKRYNSPARANEAPKDFKRGEKVLIVDIRDNIMYVEPWTEIYGSNL